MPYIQPEDREPESKTFILVTEDDIEQGDQKSSFSCPIARATRRHFGGQFKPFVQDYKIALLNHDRLDDEIATFRNSPELCRWVNEFDGQDWEREPGQKPKSIRICLDYNLALASIHQVKGE